MLNVNWLLAQDDTGSLMAALAGLLVPLAIGLAFFALFVIGAWKTFAKAGKPGWAAIIPIYNVIVMAEIAGKPLWWAIVILFVPCINIIFALLLCIDFAKAYGKGTGFGLGLFLLTPIFILLLGFGDAKYIGPQSPQS